MPSYPTVLHSGRIVIAPADSHARLGPHALQDLLVERADARRLVVSLAFRRHPDREQPIRGESKRHLAELHETAPDEPRRDYHDDRNRDLGHDQHSTGARAASDHTLTRPPRDVAQRPASCERDGCERRHERDKHRNAGRKQERARVHGHELEPRNIGRGQRDDQRCGHDGNDETADAAGEREPGRFGKGLERQMLAARAQGLPNGDVRPASGRPHEQQPGHVRAGHHHHEHDRAEQREHRRTRRTKDGVRQRRERRTVGIGWEERPVRLLPDAGQLGSCAFPIDAGTQPAEADHPEYVAILDELISPGRRDRGPIQRALWIRKSGWHDADDRVGFAVERQRLAARRRARPTADRARTDR